MRKKVLKSDLLDNKEPGFRGRFGRSIDFARMMSKDIAAIVESGDHSKERENTEM